MSNYRPDRWVILKITDKVNNTVLYKVFAGWYGGFGGSDSWKLNSGIIHSVFDGNEYQFDGNTGSTYYCHKDCEGTTSYMTSLLMGWQEQIAKSGVVTVEIISIKDYLKEPNVECN